MMLTNYKLAEISDDVAKPEYNRAQIKTGIVHIGPGAFHRGHQALYTEKTLNSFGGDWGIVGVSLRRPDVRNCLQPQDTLYTIVENGIAAGATDSSSSQYQIVGAIQKILYAAEDTGSVISVMSNDDCKIISLTITEKGYCKDLVKGGLNSKHPDIVHDIHNLEKPISAIGFIVAALKKRREAGVCVPTIVCCDNLPQNGTYLKHLVVEFARFIDLDLATWIKENVPFPNTMVDRIVPAQSLLDIEKLEANYGYRDNAVVNTEFYSQWIIEDCFASGRPAWEKVGALLVDDVQPYEKAKLRLLNGSHSAIAYLGFLSGHEYVHQVMQQPIFIAFIKHLMCEEVCPTVNPPENLDLGQYCDELLQRFTNPNLHHRTAQIAMDGSQKIPARFSGVIRSRLLKGQPIEAVSLVVAAWIRFTNGLDEGGQEYVVHDPHTEALCKLHEVHGLNTEALVEAVLAVVEVCPTNVDEGDSHKQILVERSSYWLKKINTIGVFKTVEMFVSEIK